MDTKSTYGADSERVIILLYVLLDGGVVMGYEV